MSGQDDDKQGQIAPVFLREAAGWNVAKSIPWLVAKAQPEATDACPLEDSRNQLLLLLQWPALIAIAFVLDQLGHRDEYRQDYVKLCDAVADAAYALLHPAPDCTVDAQKPCEVLNELCSSALYRKLYCALHDQVDPEPEVLHVKIPSAQRDSESVAGDGSDAAAGEMLNTGKRLRTSTDLEADPMHLMQHGDEGGLVSVIEDRLADSRNIGITGMGGIGKTAVANAVFRRAAEFGGVQCFDGTVWLQVGDSPGDVKTLLQRAFTQLFPKVPCLFESANACLEALTQRVYVSSKKVLLVLDDVWPWPDACQSAVAALNFATRPELRVEGSRLIVTTRQPCTLSYMPPQVGARPMAELHVIDVPPLSPEHAFELFRDHAYGNGSSDADPRPSSFLQTESCKEAVDACGGHPLALVSLGARLWDKRQAPEEWEACVAQERRLQMEAKDAASMACARSVEFMPPAVIECFLDFAAFPSTEEQPVPEAHLVHLFATHAPVHSPAALAAAQRALHELVQHGLVEVRAGKDGEKGYWLHGIMRDIAVQRSRDAADRCLLEHGREERALLADGRSDVHYLSNVPPALPEAFSGLELATQSNSIDQVNLLDMLSGAHAQLRACIVSQVSLPAQVRWPPQLRYLSVTGAEVDDNDHSTSDAAPDQGRQPQLPMLSFLCVRQTDDADSVIASVLPATQLFHLEVASRGELKMLHTFISQCIQLMHLNLSGCKSLKELPEGIGNCKQLTRLDLAHCNALRELPASICECHRLQHLSGCHGLRSLPEDIDDCRQLTYLSIHSSHMEQLPETIGGCAELRQLNLSSCSALTMLPESLGRCGRLAHLDVTCCSKLTQLPLTVHRLRRQAQLEIKASGTSFQDDGYAPHANPGANVTDCVVRHTLLFNSS